MTRHHNEVRDAIRDLAALAWGQVQKEPVVCVYVMLYLTLLNLRH